MKNSKIPPERVTDFSNIKLLLCYVLSSVTKPISKDVLFCALEDHGLVNYFDFSSTFAELLKNDSIRESEKDSSLYFATERAKLIASQLERNLPLSLREKALSATINLLAKIKRENENTVNIKKMDSGFCVSGNISGGHISLMSFSLYVPDELQAKLIKKNFQNSPEMVYECMLAVLTKNRSIVNSALEKFAT